MHYVICCYSKRAENICLIWSLGTAESGPISVKKQKKSLLFVCFALHHLILTGSIMIHVIHFYYMLLPL